MIKIAAYFMLAASAQSFAADTDYVQVKIEGDETIYEIYCPDKNTVNFIRRPNVGKTAESVLVKDSGEIHIAYKEVGKEISIQPSAGCVVHRYNNVRATK